MGGHRPCERDQPPDREHVLFILGLVGLILSVLYTFVWSRQNRTTTTRTYVPRDEQTTRYQ